MSLYLRPLSGSSLKLYHFEFSSKMSLYLRRWPKKHQSCDVEGARAQSSVLMWVLSDNDMFKIFSINVSIHMLTAGLLISNLLAGPVSRQRAWSANKWFVSVLFFKCYPRGILMEFNLAVQLFEMLRTRRDLWGRREARRECISFTSQR